MCKEGDIVPSNHFDTTRANIEFQKATAIDLIPDEFKNTQHDYPFKGNIDLEKLELLLSKESTKIPLIMITVTNNTGGGQPVSMSNIREVSKISKNIIYHFILMHVDLLKMLFSLRKEKKIIKTYQ